MGSHSDGNVLRDANATRAPAHTRQPGRDMSSRSSGGGDIHKGPAPHRQQEQQQKQQKQQQLRPPSQASQRSLLDMLSGRGRRSSAGHSHSTGAEAARPPAPAAPAFLVISSPTQAVQQRFLEVQRLVGRDAVGEYREVTE